MSEFHVATNKLPAPGWMPGTYCSFCHQTWPCQADLTDQLVAERTRADDATADADHLRKSLLVLANATAEKWKERAETAESRERALREALGNLAATSNVLWDAQAMEPATSADVQKKQHAEVNALGPWILAVEAADAALADSPAPHSPECAAAEARVIEAAGNVIQAWMRLGKCEAEFMPEYPDACAEYADHLDICISNLHEALNPGENERLVKLGMEVFNQVLEQKRSHHSHEH